MCEVKNKGFNYFLKFILIYIGILLFFVLFMVLGCLFPSKLIDKNVRESSKILIDEGLDHDYDTFFFARVDNYTDVLMINEAYSVDNTNPLYSALSVRKNYKNGVTRYQDSDITGELEAVGQDTYRPDLELESFLNGKIDTSINYARYWHGYLPVLRLLLIFFNVSEIRMLFFFIFSILFIWLFILLLRKFNLRIAFIYVFSLFVVGYFAIPKSLQNIPIFLVMMFSCITLLMRFEKIKSFSLYIFIVGCIANFIDSLTVPLITLAMPLYIYLLKYDCINWKDKLKLVFKYAILWFVGYVGVWLSKWIIFDLLYNQGLIESAITQVLYRSVHPNSFGYSPENNVILLLIVYFLSYGFEYSLFLLVPYCIFILLNINSVKFRFKGFKDYFKNCVPYLVICLFPIIWYLVLKNQTLSHDWFVCRHMLVFITGILLCFTNIFVVRRRR